MLSPLLAELGELCHDTMTGAILAHGRCTKSLLSETEQ